MPSLRCCCIPRKLNDLLGFYGPPLETAGVKQILPVGPDAFGKLDSHALMDVLDAATGVMVGGGDTEIYWRLVYAGSGGR